MGFKKENLTLNLIKPKIRVKKKHLRQCPSAKLRLTSFLYNHFPFSRRPIVTEEDLLIDPDLLDTSNGRRIAGWVKLRSQLPAKRAPLFDLAAARSVSSLGNNLLLPKFISVHFRMFRDSVYTIYLMTTTMKITSQNQSRL